MGNLVKNVKSVSLLHYVLVHLHADDGLSLEVSSTATTSAAMPHQRD